MAKKPKKVFSPGQPIDFVREAGWDDMTKWEPGTYSSTIPEMRGWHRVYDGSGVKHIVPARRVRERKAT